MSIINAPTIDAALQQAIRLQSYAQEARGELGRVSRSLGEASEWVAKIGADPGAAEQLTGSRVRLAQSKLSGAAAGLTGRTVTEDIAAVSRPSVPGIGVPSADHFVTAAEHSLLDAVQAVARLRVNQHPDAVAEAQRAIGETQSDVAHAVEQLHSV